jgi:hypothetical protein
MEPEPETKVLPRGNADVTAPPPAEPGGPLQRIGRYEVVQRLGHGGMATVYLGRATGSAGFERVVAVKVIHPHLAAEPEFVEMFLDEARIAAKIHSPHVAGILDLGEDAGFYYMVMEYIDGETLSALLRQLRPRDERLPLAVALQVLADACEGLVAVHNLRDPDGRPYGLVHRDMSPQNLIINFDGWTKIVDFGLVKATGVRNSHTGHLRGKLAYMAPEQARGKAVSASTDLFALGVIFWEMLTGKRLFAGEGDAETLDNVIRCEVPPLREARPDVPPAIEAMLRRALAREPEDRYQSAEAMLTDIRALLRECGDTSEPRRALGAIMQHHFAEQAKYRMAAIRGASRGDNRPRMRLVAPPSGPLTAAPTAEDSTRPEPAVVQLDGDESTGTRVLIHAGGSGSRSGAREVAEEMASTSRVPMADIRPWKLWLALPLLGAAIAAAVLLFVLPRNEPEPIQPAPRSEPTPERTPTPEPPRPRSVVWNFETEPSGASMDIQGATPEVAAALAGQIEGKVTPLRLVVPYDEDTRLSVVFSKPGHKPVRRSLIPVNNQNFDVELPPEPTPTAVDPGPTNSATQPTKKRPSKHHETKTNPPPDTKAGVTDELKDEPKFDSSPSHSSSKGGK